MTKRTLKEQLLSDGAFDDLDLMWISQVVEDFVEPKDESRLISATAEALEDLLEDNLVTLGDVVKLDGGGYEIRSWGISPSEARRRIETEWRALKRPIESSEIVWMELTSVGYDIGKKLLEEDERREQEGRDA